MRWHDSYIQLKYLSVSGESFFRKSTMSSVSIMFRASARLYRGTQRRWMSVRPQEVPKAEARKKVTLCSLQQLRNAGIPITMLTAYDYSTGLACSAHGIDITLVGDSLAQVCLGYSSTTQLTLDEMIHHSKAVARGSTTPLLVADMPYGTYYSGPEATMKNAVRLIQEGNVEGIKMEGGLEITDTVAKLTSMGIPVMAHVGLLPQRHTSLSGYKVQGKNAKAAQGVLHSALALQEAGAFSIVLEAIPHRLGAYITSKLRIPTIGIGAGPNTDGQVLVWDDIMGTWSGHKAKFVRRFADMKAEREHGIHAYMEAVKARDFPSLQEESYGIDKGEWEEFVRAEDERNSKKQAAVSATDFNEKVY